MVKYCIGTKCYEISKQADNTIRLLRWVSFILMIVLIASCFAKHASYPRKIIALIFIIVMIVEILVIFRAIDGTQI